MSKITKLLVFILLLILVIFLAFPVWSGWVLKSQLPDNIKLISLETGYPGFQNISIDHIQFISNEMTITVKDLQVNYDFSKIDIGNINLKKINQAQTNEAIVRLPIIEMDKLELLDKFQSITIDKLDFHDSNNQQQVFKLIFTKTADKKYQIIFNKAVISGLTIPSLSLQTSIYTDSDTINLTIISEKNLLLEGTYQQTDKKQQVIAKLNTEILQSVLDYQVPELPFKPLGLMDINILLRKENTELELEIKQNLVPSIDLFQQQSITLKPLENHLVDTLLLPVVMKINSNSKQFPLKATVDIKSAPLSDLQIESVQADLTIKSPQLTLVSDLLITQNQAEDLTIQLSNNTFLLSMSSLILAPASEPLTINLTKIKVNAKANDFQQVLSSSNKKNTNQQQWKLSGIINASTVESKNYTSTTDESLKAQPKSIKLTTKPLINFEFLMSDAIENELLTSGKILFSELLIEDFVSHLNGHLQLSWSDVNTDFSTGKMHLDLYSDDGSLSGIDLDDLKLASDFYLSEKNIHGEGELLLNEHILTPFQINIDKKSNEVTLELVKNQLENQLINQFLVLLSDQNNMVLKIIDGDISHEGEVSLNKELNVESRINVSNMSFQLGKNSISGINLKHLVNALEPLTMLSDLTIKKIQFASGLDFSNLKARVESLAKDQFEITSLSGETLDGRFKSDLIKTSKDGFEETILELQDLSLTELVFFMDIPGLYSEGNITFKIPLTMQSGSFIVQDGTFKAEGKGIIKYTSDHTSSKGEENIALMALKNFHFTSLDGTLSYNQSGEYRIKLHLLGSNPDLYDGYPVDFSLNLQGKLPGVFRSLFITGNFQQAVLDKVRSGQLEK